MATKAAAPASQAADTKEEIITKWFPSFLNETLRPLT
jgi:hypothetical protein